LLTAGSDVYLNSFGDAIGGDAPAGTAWSTPGFSGAGLLFYWWNRFGRIINDQVDYSGWFGPLASTGIGYIGVRFHAADGLHYGWIRVRMPNPDPWLNIIEFGPVLVDCAYESRPNVLIDAGDIGANSGSIQFVVDLRNPDGTPHGSGQYHSVGTAILTGKTLRFELDMIGWLYSAELRGPAPSRSRSKRLYVFGQPLVAIHSPCTAESCDPDFTVFFGEAVLNPGQVSQLKRGVLYVSVDNAAAIGTCKLAE
jgi:hypothetical protein